MCFPRDPPKCEVFCLKNKVKNMFISLMQMGKYTEKDKRNFMDSFLGQGSAVSKMQSYCEETVYF